MKLIEDLNSMLRDPNQVKSMGRDLADGMRGGRQSQRAGRRQSRRDQDDQQRQEQGGRQSSKEQYQAQGKRVKAEIFKLLKMANEAGVMPRGRESETFDILVKELKSSMFGSR